MSLATIVTLRAPIRLIAGALPLGNLAPTSRTRPPLTRPTPELLRPAVTPAPDLAAAVRRALNAVATLPRRVPKPSTRKTSLVVSTPDCAFPLPWLRTPMYRARLKSDTKPHHQYEISSDDILNNARLKPGLILAGIAIHHLIWAFGRSAADRSMSSSPPSRLSIALCRIMHSSPISACNTPRMLILEVPGYCCICTIPLTATMAHFSNDNFVFMERYD